MYKSAEVPYNLIGIFNSIILICTIEHTSEAFHFADSFLCMLPLFMSLATILIAGQRAKMKINALVSVVCAPRDIKLMHCLDAFQIRQFFTNSQRRTQM